MKAHKRLAQTDHEGHARIGVRSSASIVMMLWTMLYFIALSFPAHAQDRVLKTVVLTPALKELSLAPYTLVQPDPENKVTPQAIQSSGGTILTGAVAPYDMIGLGYRGDSTWLTVKLDNQSLNENWIIDLGHRSQGRLGYLKSARAYELEFSGGQAVVTEVAGHSNTGVYEFRIPTGSQKFILLNLRPVAGKPAVLPAKLYSERAYIKHIDTVFTPYAAHSFFLLLYTIFFATLALARSEKKIGIFAAFFFYELCIWTMTERMGAIIGFGMFDLLIPVMFLGYTLFSIFLAKTFFNIEYGSFTERSVLNGLIWLNIIATLMAFLLPISGGLTQISLLYGAPLITFSLLTLMAGAQSSNGNTPARYYFAGTLFPVIGLLIVIAGLFSLVPYDAFLINSLWYSVSFQGLFMAIAVYKKFNAQQGAASYIRINSDDVDFSKLQETKDKADHARLLKVIEKERELLAEFRAKESERVDEMRRAKEEADEANRAKSAFLAVVSHEIRTPMTGVMGMVRLLLDSSITKQQRDYVLAIQESSEAMMALLNDILDFERIQRGKIELENISFDLHRLIQGVITLMSGHAAEKGILLSARVDDDLPKFVKGDPTRLRQVLLNLMGNAIKFTSEGSVTLLVKNMSQGETDKNQLRDNDKFMIYFAVQDTGIGISGEQKKNLFTPFAQANSSITRKFGGTGLGLAISKGLIETMGSMININSKEGEGSTFFFTLDMARGVATSTEKPVSRPTEDKLHIAPLRILVVDDNTITRKVMVGFLEGGQHEIITASDAEEALRKINQDAFDLVFMDIEMPGMRGNEATKILREHKDRVKAAIPVIAMTGNIAKEDKERYLADGMSGFVAKPIEADQIRAIVDEVARHTFEREIRMPEPSVDPFAQSPEEIAAHAKKIEEIPADRNIFNPDMLQSLKDAIGAQQLGELLTELIVKTEEILQAMGDAEKQNDLSTLAARAHELKGMAGNFGLVEVSAIAAQAERKAKTADTTDLSALVHALPEASLRAQNALKDWSSQ